MKFHRDATHLNKHAYDHTVRLLCLISSYPMRAFLFPWTFWKSCPMVVKEETESLPPSPQIQNCINSDTFLAPDQYKLPRTLWDSKAVQYLRWICAKGREGKSLITDLTHIVSSITWLCVERKNEGKIPVLKTKRKPQISCRNSFIRVWGVLTWWRRLFVRNNWTNISYLLFLFHICISSFFSRWFKLVLFFVWGKGACFTPMNCPSHVIRGGANKLLAPPAWRPFSPQSGPASTRNTLWGDQSCWCAAALQCNRNTFLACYVSRPLCGFSGPYCFSP